MYPTIYRHLFPNVNEWEVVLGRIASDAEVVIPRFGHYIKLASKLGALPVAWVDRSKRKREYVYLFFCKEGTLTSDKWRVL